MPNARARSHAQQGPHAIGAPRRALASMPALAAWLALAAGGWGQAAVTYTSADTPRVVSANWPLISSTITVPDSFQVTDVNVTVQVSRGFDREFQLSLSHTGYVVLHHPFRASLGLNKTYDDEATAPYTADVHTVRPYEPLSDFNWTQASGAWTLTYCDASRAGIKQRNAEGTIVSWSLTLNTPDHKPDAAIDAGSGLVGTGVYYGELGRQTVTRTVAPGVTANYLVEVENDGDHPEPFLLTGTGGNAGWSVRYLEYWTNNDITEAVTGAGWLTGSVRYYAHTLRFRMQVTPQSGRVGGRHYTTVLRAASVADPTRFDCVRAHTFCTHAYQPDGMIWQGGARWQGGGYVGDDVFSAKGVGQTTSVCAPTAHYLLFANDGSTHDSFRIRGTGGDADWTVRYLEYTTGTDITSDVTGSGWVTPVLPAGRTSRLKLMVTPVRGAGRRGRHVALVTANSLGDEAKLDAVMAVTTVPDTYQPDGVFADGGANLGDDVYNSTGGGQKCTRMLQAGDTTTFYPRFYNDGNVPQALRITGTAGHGIMTVQYLEYWSGADITSDVTGAGWVTPSLAPGAAARLRVVVSIGLDAWWGTFSILLTGTSTVDATKLDVLKAWMGVEPLPSSASDQLSPQP